MAERKRLKEGRVRLGQIRNDELATAADILPTYTIDHSFDHGALGEAINDFTIDNIGTTRANGPPSWSPGPYSWLAGTVSITDANGDGCQLYLTLRLNHLSCFRCCFDFYQLRFGRPLVCCLCPTC